MHRTNRESTVAGSIGRATSGTFRISVVAALGASGLPLLSPLATTINYGTFESNGELVATETAWSGDPLA